MVVQKDVNIFAKKNKKMVPGNFSCDNFEKSYRSHSEKEKIYYEGKEYKKEFKENIGGYVILLVILLILGLLVGIFF